jgi:quercetin dioxygenase-like cupin family protein
MFYSSTDDGYTEPIPGIRMKTLTYGDKTLMTEFRLEAGRLLPGHQHVHEQTGYLVKGRIRLTIGDRTFDVSPGDSWAIAGNTVHSAEILESSVAIEVFSPVREDYLPQG